MPVLAIIPAIAAVSGAVAAGSALTLSAGLALGATVVGAGLSLAGEITGSKTLRRVGLGFSAAGSIGGVLSAANNLSNNKSASNSNAIDARNTDPSSSEGLLKSKVTGAKDVIADKVFSKQGRDAIGTFNQPDIEDMASVNTNPGEVEPSIFEKFNSKLNKYNTALNIVGGMGDAYMENKRYETAEDIATKDREQAQFNADRRYNATTGQMANRTVALNPAVQGLLRAGAR